MSASGVESFRPPSTPTHTFIIDSHQQRGVHIHRTTTSRFDLFFFLFTNKKPLNTRIDTLECLTLYHPLYSGRPIRALACLGVLSPKSQSAAGWTIGRNSLPRQPNHLLLPHRNLSLILNPNLFLDYTSLLLFTTPTSTPLSTQPGLLLPALYPSCPMLPHPSSPSRTDTTHTPLPPAEPPTTFLLHTPNQPVDPPSPPRRHLDMDTRLGW